MTDQRRPDGSLYCYQGIPELGRHGCRYCNLNARTRLHHRRQEEDPCVTNHDRFYFPDGSLKPHESWPHWKRHEITRERYKTHRAAGATRSEAIRATAEETGYTDASVNYIIKTL